MVDRRQIPRWQIRQKMKIRLKGALTFVDCYVHDINLKGMQVAFPMELPDETCVRMNMALTKDVNVETEAHIPWHRQDGKRHIYGLSFSKIKDGDKDQIYEYVCFNSLDQLKDRWWQGTQASGEVPG